MKKHIKTSFFLILVSLFYGCSTILVNPYYEYATLKPYKYDKKVSFYINKVDNQSENTKHKIKTYSSGGFDVNIKLFQLPDEIVFDAIKYALEKLGILADSPDSADYLINVRVEHFYFQPESGDPPKTFELSIVSFFKEKNSDKNILVLRSKASSSEIYLDTKGFNMALGEAITIAVNDFIDNGINPIVEKTVSSLDNSTGEKGIKPLLDITFNHKNLISLTYSFAPWPEPNIIEYDITAKDPYIDSYFQIKTSYGTNDVFAENKSILGKKNEKYFEFSHKFPETAFTKDSEFVTITQKIPYVDTSFISYHTIKYPNFFNTEMAFEVGGMIIDKNVFGKPLGCSISYLPAFMEFTFGKVSSTRKIELSSQIAGGQIYDHEYNQDSALIQIANLRMFYWQEKLNIEAGKKLLPGLRILGGLGGEYRWGFQEYDDYKTFGVDEKNRISEYSPFLKTGVAIGREITLGYEQHLGKYSQQVMEVAYRDWFGQTDLSFVWDKKIQRVYFGITSFVDPYTATTNKNDWNWKWFIGTVPISLAAVCWITLDILGSIDFH